MPEKFQKIITIDIDVPVRKKANGVFEARFRKNGFNVSVSSKQFEKLKEKMLSAFLSIEKESGKAIEKAPSKNFEEIAQKWLTLRRPEIKEKTITFYESLFRATLFPAFEGKEISEIKQSDVQILINRYIEAKPRTAVKIFQTLRSIFEFAIGEELIERSPMRMLKLPKYEKNSGVALTLAEEVTFLQKIEQSKCDQATKDALRFLLYTGLRRSELASVRIEEGFVVVVCAKVRKGFREKKRSIPITPMLEVWLPKIDLEALRAVRPDALTLAMKRIMPDHHLHELRHTFITRCQECGVPREVVSVWAGHAADNTQTSNVYTHFSPEFMKKEGKKVLYELITLELVPN